MSEESVCNQICAGIKDEREGQRAYEALSKELHGEGYPEEAFAVERLITTDEKKHEDYLEVLNKSHMCNCK